MDRSCRWWCGNHHRTWSTIQTRCNGKRKVEGSTGAGVSGTSTNFLFYFLYLTPNCIGTTTRRYALLVDSFQCDVDDANHLLYAYKTHKWPVWGHEWSEMLWGARTGSPCNQRWVREEGGWGECLQVLWHWGTRGTRVSRVQEFREYKSCMPIVGVLRERELTTRYY